MKKKLLEIITRHLAPPARLAAFLLAAFTVGGAWAATLSYSGYISTDSANPTAVFSGVRLSDIGTKYVLAGKMGGYWVSTKEAAGVYNASSDGTTLTVQFQKVDGDSDKYVKCVIVKFTEATVNDINTIYAYAHATGNSTTLVLGQDFSSAAGTPSTGDNVDGYGMFDLSLTAGKKFEFKTTGTGSTYTTSGGQAAKPFWTLKVPTSTSLPENTLVKLTDIRIGSRATSWTANYDSAYMCVTNVNNEGIYSSQVSAYVANRKLMWGSTPVNVLQYQFPDSTPVMVNAGSPRGVVCYYADKTYAANNNNPGGAYLVSSGENIPYALNMNPLAGGNWRPVQEVEVLVVATATASANANWSALAWSNGAADWTAAGSTPVLLTVTEDCTITLDSAVSLESIVFDIADGKTLTLSGANTITAANGIIIKGGTVAVANTTTLSGTLYGNGTLAFSGVYGTALSNIGVTATSTDWRGTVSFSSVTAKSGWKLNSYGNANSTIRFDGITDGYFNDKETFDGTVDIGSGGLTLNYGNGGGTLTTITTLTGSGEFKITGGSTYNGGCGVCVKNIDGFTGKLTLAQGCNQILTIGTTGATGSAGKIVVANGATATAKGEWSAAGGLEVSGTLTVNPGATVPTIKTTDTAAYIFSSTATIGTVSGSSIGSQLFITSGTVSVTDTTITSLTIPAQVGTTYQNLGMLDLSGCTSLTTLYFDLGTCMTVEMTKIVLPAGCTVYAKVGSVRDLAGYSITGANYFVEETKAEYGAGSLTVENVPTGASVAVKRVDGTIVSATVDGTTATLTSEVKIDGAATYCDATFTNTVSMAYTTDNVVVRSPATGNYNNSAADKTTGIMVYDTPWLGTSDAWNIANMGDFQSDMTVAVVGQMPACKDNAMFLHIGGCKSGVNGIIIARTANDNEAFVAYNQGSRVTKLTTMTVPNADSARHVYVVTKHDTASTTTFTIYLDGIKWKTVPLDFVLAISGGVQVGSDFHGAIHPVTQTDTDGSQYVLKSITSSASPAAGYATDTTGYINCIRIYDRILTQAEIDQYSAPEEYPYVSPHGSSARTFDTTNEAWVEDGATDWANTYEETTTQAEAPRAGSALTVNTSVATTISANLESTVSYDSLTVNGTGATFAKVNGYGGVISVAGSSVIGAPVTINAGALVLGGPVTITEGGSVTFNYSDYEVASADVIQLTGEMEEAESGKITITPPADQHYTYTYGYSGTQYVITPAVAVAVLDHGGDLTGYTTADAALADAVSGDTVTLQTAYLTPGTHATYASDKTGVNVIVRGYTIAPAVADGTTTWSTSSYIWTGAGADNNWTTPANWGLASGYPGSSGAANSQNTDNVLVPSAATITLTGNAYLTGVTISGNLTLTGGGTLYARTISGSKVILSGATLRAYQNGKTADANSLVISSDVEIADGTENGFYMGKTSDNNFSTQFELAGALTGSGKVTVTISHGSYQGITMSGDASQFTGEWVVSGSGDVTQFSAATQVSGTASYTFNSRNNGANGSYPFNLSGGSFAVGALNGTIYSCGGSNRAHGMTITIGGRNEDCSFGGSIGYASSYCNNLVKTGTADMTYTGGGFYGSMTIQNGTYIIGSTDANPATIIFQGGALSVAEGVTVDPSSHFSSDSTAAVVFDDRGYDNEWATALTATTAPHGLTKKGPGTLTLTKVPTYTGATTVEAGTLVVPQGTVIGELALVEGAKLAVPFTGAEDNTAVVTVTALASGTTQSMLEAALVGGTGMALSVESGESGYVVKATHTALTYNWTGATSSDWDTLSNWSVTVDNEAVTPTLPPASVDTVVFPATEEDAVNTVVLDGDKSVLTFMVNGGTRISGGCIIVMGSYSGTEKIGNNDYDAYRNDSTVSGAGTLYLGEGGGVKSRQEGVIQVVSITVPEIVIEGTADNHSYLSGWRKTKGGMATTQVHATAAVTGSGYVEIGGNRGSAWLTSAKWSDFEGHVIIFDDNQSRDCTQFESETAVASLESSSWNVPSANSNFTPNGTEYTFGELTGSPTWSSAGNSTTVNVGKLGTSFSLGGTYNNAVKLVKQGAGTMTFTGLKPGDITVDGGELKFSSQYYITNKVLAVSANATLNATEDFFVNGANGELNVSGSANVGAAGAARWLFIQQGATVNLNAGGTLSICRMTATDGAENINFNGGTLQSYGDGNGNENIIGAYGDTGAITMKVLAGGAVVDTQSFSTTITGDIQSGVQSGTDGGFTKRGAGTLTLAGTLSYTGPTAVEAGYLVIPDSTSVTFGENTIVSARDTTAGTMTLAYATTVALTVPAVDGTTVAVTYVDSNGDTQTVAVSDTANVYLVPVGTEVTVTYTGTTGTVVTSGGTITGIYNEAAAVDTTDVATATVAVWEGDVDNGWTTAGNWSTGSVPDENTPVEFPNTGSAYTVWIGTDSKCGTMQIDGDVTFAQWDDNFNWNQEVSLYGNVTGRGTLTLRRTGIDNKTGATITFSPNLVIAETKNGNEYADSWISGWNGTASAAVVVNGEVTVNGKLVLWHTKHTFNNNVTFADGAFMGDFQWNGITFNGSVISCDGTAYIWASTPGIDGTGVTFDGSFKVNYNPQTEIGGYFSDCFGTAGTYTSAPISTTTLTLMPDASIMLANDSVITAPATDAAYHAIVGPTVVDGVKTYACVIPAENAPAIDMTAASPVTVTTSGETPGVTFTVDPSSLKSGLYYRIKAVDGNGDVDADASTAKVQFTGDNFSQLKFTAPLPTDGVLYYTIEASDSAE